MRLEGLLAGIFFCLMAPIAVAESPGPNNRAEAVKIVAEMRRIVTPQGVERLEKVRIGGIDQWIAVRGFDRRNPILLYLHGGPGFPAMPTSWYYQRGWEEYFTVVQWDQRGAGKTYATNDPASVAPTITPARMIADTEEMIGWLRKEFGKDRIFVLGHSWGSYLGLDIARRHPEWLHAYIGMGQLTDARESERRGWQFAMEHARSANNATAVRELQSIAGYEKAAEISLDAIKLQRKWLGFYGGAVRGRKSFDHEDVGTTLAPEYSDADVELVWKANRYSMTPLLPTVLKTDFSSVTRLACPIVLFNGRDDYNVSASLAAEWLERLQAPSKTLVWFERSAHDIVNEEPGKVLLSLVQHVRPIAERAGDIAPP
ncbi:MAG: alpha/beta hydrolase [Steroidobacteraceae bacterium]